MTKFGKVDKPGINLCLKKGTYSRLSLLPIAENIAVFNSLISLSNLSFSQFLLWISASNAAVGGLGKCI